MVSPEGQVVAACAAHLDDIGDQVAAVARYARHEVLGDAGFEGVFAALTPLLHRVGGAVEEGLGAVRRAYRDTAHDVRATGREFDAVDELIADSLRLLAARAQGVRS